MRDLVWFLEQLQGPLAPTRAAMDGRSVMDSSLNQRMGPRDCNFFLRDEPEGGRLWHVLVDHTGPGCITRFWTAGDFDGELEIWLDGERWLATGLRQFFGGELDPFLPPLVLGCGQSSGGRVCYLPIPFARSCTIRATSDTESFYWQVNARLYELGTGVVTLPRRLDGRSREALEAVQRRWASDNGLAAPGGADVKPLVVPARGETTVFETDGAGVIDALVVEADGGDPTPLALQACWDGRTQPDVAVPLGHFFCQGTRRRDFSSLPLGRRGDRFTCAFTMPFGEGALIKLVNPSTADVSLAAGVQACVGDPATGLRFHARYRHEQFGYGTLFQALNRQGRGLFAGLYLVTEQAGEAHHACFNQEGNEYLYVDGEQDPSWRGTGTEDYFNCGYFYQCGEVATPTHGCLDQRYGDEGESRRGLVAAYRFHLLDAVPYRKSLQMLLEAGCPRKGALAGANGLERLTYRWTCYWYEEPPDADAESREPLV